MLSCLNLRFEENRYALGQLSIEWSWGWLRLTMAERGQRGRIMTSCFVFQLLQRTSAQKFIFLINILTMREGKIREHHREFKPPHSKQSSSENHHLHHQLFHRHPNPLSKPFVLSLSISHFNITSFIVHWYS